MDPSMDSTTDPPILSRSLTEVTHWAKQAFRQDFEALPSVKDLTFEPLDGCRRRGIALDRLQHPASHILRVGVHQKISKLHGALVVFACIDHAKTLNGDYYLAVRYINMGDLGYYISTREANIVWGEPFSRMTTGSSNNQQIKSIIYWFFFAIGYLDRIYGYGDFKSDFKAACARMNRKSSNKTPTPKKSQALPPRARVLEGDQKSAKLPKPLEGNIAGHKGTDDLQERAAPANIPKAQPDTSTPESPASKYKRARHEMDDAYNALEEKNKRLKIEIGELKVKKDQLATEKRLEGDNYRLRQELQEEKANMQSLSQELAVKEEARADAEKKAIDAVARAERSESRANTERDIANQMLAAKARLELELEVLKVNDGF